MTKKHFVLYVQSKNTIMVINKRHKIIETENESQKVLWRFFEENRHTELEHGVIDPLLPTCLFFFSRGILKVFNQTEAAIVLLKAITQNQSCL